jgi:hypothetical protein
MTSETQAMEVVRLNKRAATGMKGAIRKQRIDVQFKTLVSERMKEFLIQNRTQPQHMFRTVAQPRILQKLQLRFLSIGEWVEVDADMTPGWNSEGGIAVIIDFNDGIADVKYEPSLACKIFICLLCYLAKKVRSHTLGRETSSVKASDDDNYAPQGKNSRAAT